MDTRQTISVEQLAERSRQQDIDLVDVRTPVEFQAVHAEFARNTPLDSLDPHAVMSQRVTDSSEPLYVICKGGKRGEKAQRKFAESGFDNVVNVMGGTDAWAAAGLPVVRGKSVMSLERQVRITAGLIVLTGSIAALVTGNVYFAGIPAFVGAGLVFAGITNSCAMGMLLAKMPWNQVRNNGECCTPKLVATSIQESPK